MTSMHTGQRKSGPWLLAASLHEADVAVQPNAVPPSHPGMGNKPVLPQSQPRQGTQGDWVNQDWRNGNGGAFSSPVRPPMSSDIPHPDKVEKMSPQARKRVAASEDPEHDPWNVLGGSGQTFEGLVSNHLSHQNNMTPEQEYQGRAWYRAAHEGTKDLAAKTTGDHERAVSTMSAFSPKTAWDENVEKGHHFLTHYNGDPNFDMPGMSDHVEKAKAIYHAGEPGAAYADPRDVIKGPKTSAFRNNIHDDTPMREPRPGEHDDAGYYHHPVNPGTGEPDWRLSPDQDSTIDTHHVRMANTPHGADLSGLKYETPKHFGQTVMADGQELDPSYDLYSRAAWEATRRQNAGQGDPYRHLLPKQMQAGPWGKFKTDVDSAGKGANFTEPGTAPKSWDPNKKNFSPENWAEKHPFSSPKKPIPRYQQDHGDWEDPRRPKEDLRTSPNWHRHRKSSTNSPWWDHVLADYIARHPQHPGHSAEHFARAYFAADEALMNESVEIKKRPIRTKPYSKTHNKLPKKIHQPKEPKKMLGAENSAFAPPAPVQMPTLNTGIGTTPKASTPVSPIPGDAPSPFNSGNVTREARWAAQYFGALKKASPPAAPGAQPPGGNWGAMPDVKLGPSAPPGYQPGATPAAAWVPASSAGGGGSNNPVSGTQTNKGTTGPDTHGSILPDTAAFQQSLQKQFPQLTNIGGYRQPDGFNEHSSGHALDVMIPDTATQNQVRDWALKQPNVNYILNQQKQWNPDGSSSAMDNRGSPTANHMDHLHVNVAGEFSPDPSAGSSSSPIKPLPGLKGLDDGSGSSTGNTTPGSGTPMTIARRFAQLYFTADDDKDKDQQPGQDSSSQSGSSSTTPTNSGAYGAGASINPASMDLSLHTPVPTSNFVPSHGGGGGSGYSGGSGAAAASAGGGAAGVPSGGPPSQSLTEALTRAGIPAEMHPLIQGFSTTEGNNPSGAPTLGFTDGQAGTTLDQHAQALAKQFKDRAPVAGAFPSGGSPQEQANWMATVVGQNGSQSDWQGNRQPARSDYTNRIVRSMPSAAPTPAAGPSLPSTGTPSPKVSSMHSGAPKSGPWLLEASSHGDA